MSRLTQAQQVQHGQEQQAIAYFEGTLEPLDDPRRGQGKRYPLRAVIIATMYS